MIINQILEMADWKRYSGIAIESRGYRCIISQGKYSVWRGYQKEESAVSCRFRYKTSLCCLWSDKVTGDHAEYYQQCYKVYSRGHSIHVEIHEAASENPSKIHYIFSCEDTGIGMSEEYLPHVYEEFSREHTTTENKVQGTGLGLSIIKSMIELMGGSIQVESRQHIGTKFTVDFSLT